MFYLDLLTEFNKVDHCFLLHILSSHDWPRSPSFPPGLVVYPFRSLLLVFSLQALNVSVSPRAWPFFFYIISLGDFIQPPSVFKYHLCVSVWRGELMTLKSFWSQCSLKYQILYLAAYLTSLLRCQVGIYKLKRLNG